MNFDDLLDSVLDKIRSPEPTEPKTYLPLMAFHVPKVAIGLAGVAEDCLIFRIDGWWNEKEQAFIGYQDMFLEGTLLRWGPELVSEALGFRYHSANVFLVHSERVCEDLKEALDIEEDLIEKVFKDEGFIWEPGSEFFMVFKNGSTVPTLEAIERFKSMVKGDIGITGFEINGCTIYPRGLVNFNFKLSNK